MRPSCLFPLFAEMTTLKGIGPRLAVLYKKLCGGTRLIDLLWHLPQDVIDRRYAPRLVAAESGRVATLLLSITEHKPPARAGKPYHIEATDGSAPLQITYFNTKGDYLSRLYPVGQMRFVSGLLERFQGSWIMNHPDFVVAPDQKNEIPSLEPVYPLTQGLANRGLVKSVRQALDRTPALTEWHDEHLLSRERWPTWKDSLLLAHDPLLAEQTGQGTSARRRLAYDECLADQLALALIRQQSRQRPGCSMTGTKALNQGLLASLPFQPTKAQVAAFQEISADMAAPTRMLRLLQGDVGSGKTLVALMAMLQAVESGFQAVLLAPTEILAKQHFDKLSSFLKPLGLPIGLLLGKKGRAKERKETLTALAHGDLPLVVGTHALFQEEVVFHRLGLAVVDEQHRFGVHQRLQMTEKGQAVDILAMTATPIPRTLTLTAYGDMDVSRLMEKPAGRQPIDTRLIDVTRLDAVIEGLARHIGAGKQAYWVCPLVEESEKSDLAAATDRADLLARRFGAMQVGLVHGRLSPDQKNAVMERFASGQIKILVATTVIEVGVDVPNASLMIIEHAERFGLAALHQLRGRVGRGAVASVCLLLYQGPLSQIATERLKLLRETEDGFRIAEEDLRLRGPGEVMGTRQSGLPVFRLADLMRDQDLLHMARQEADLILNKDPELVTPRGKALRTLLYLFEKDTAVRLFRSG